MSKPIAHRCKNREGLAVGTCGGKLVVLTLRDGDGFRRRLWCEVCGRPGSDKRD